MSNLYVFDLEGTISNHSNRLHLLPTSEEKVANSKDHYAAFHAAFPNDRPHNHIVRMMNAFYHYKCDIIILTGMMEKHRPMATKWLLGKAIPFDKIIMRDNDDFTPSPEFKLHQIEKYQKITAYNWSDVFVFDDRADIVDYLNSVKRVVPVESKEKSIIHSYNIHAFKVN